MLQVNVCQALEMQVREEVTALQLHSEHIASFSSAMQTADIKASQAKVKSILHDCISFPHIRMSKASPILPFISRPSLNINCP